MVDSTEAEERYTASDTDGRKEEDLLIISQWVRKEFFVNVKVFISAGQRLGSEWSNLQKPVDDLPDSETHMGAVQSGGRQLGSNANGGSNLFVDRGPPTQTCARPTTISGPCRSVPAVDRQYMSLL
jgi:hypothetical protein